MRYRDVGIWSYDTARATEGFTIVSPLWNKNVYLIGMKGDIRHSWNTDLHPGNYAYILSGGNLLWAGETPGGANPAPGGGAGGLLREYDWDGNIVWEYQDDFQHHDFRRLANGNTVYIGWEPVPGDIAEKIQGAEAGTEYGEDKIIWGDYLREVNPAGETVWEWHAHEDETLLAEPLHPMSTRKEFAHCNAVSETADGDLLLSFRKFSIIAKINKASGKTVWYHRDDNWGQQHDCTMLDNGNILFFANGICTPRGVYTSAVIEFNPETRQDEWKYEGSPKPSFYSPNISGAQRLWSGNTLICEGMTGRIFEVTPASEIVWEYISPWFGHWQGGPANGVFRAYRYDPNGPELEGRLGSAA